MRPPCGVDTRCTSTFSTSSVLRLTPGRDVAGETGSGLIAQDVSPQDTMWIQLLAPLVMLAAVGLLVQGIYLGRQSKPTATQVGADRIARWVAFGLALIPSLLLLVVPVYSGLREVANTGG